MNRGAAGKEPPTLLGEMNGRLLFGDVSGLLLCSRYIVVGGRFGGCGGGVDRVLGNFIVPTTVHGRIEKVGFAGHEGEKVGRPLGYEVVTL